MLDYFVMDHTRGTRSSAVSSSLSSCLNDFFARGDGAGS